MRSGKDFPGQRAAAPSREDSLRQAQRLAPSKKNGKERYALFGELQEDEGLELESYPKRESALDYYDDEES